MHVYVLLRLPLPLPSLISLVSANSPFHYKLFPHIYGLLFCGWHTEVNQGCPVCVTMILELSIGVWTARE